MCNVQQYVQNELKKKIKSVITKNNFKRNEPF